MKLTEEQLGEQLLLVDGWNREDGKWIVRKFRFAEFMRGIEFVNEVARISEELNHHPLIAIDYKLVTLRLTTWNEGGLTELDIRAAQFFDQAFGSLNH